jgi:magnesium-transporting ATPase (P-type)
VGAYKIGLKAEELETFFERIYELPFSSSRKMMVTVCRGISESDLKHVGVVGEFTVHVKGAPNYIIEKCTKYIAADGSIVILDAASRKRFMDKVDELSSKALRVLAVATRKLGSHLPYKEDAETDDKFMSLTEGLTLSGLCASIDPERDGVKEAVLQSKVAGVRVVMITGDYLKTAIAIAKNINIIDSEITTEGICGAIDCNALHQDGAYLEENEMDKLTRTTSVFARAKPEDKLEIVKSLQRQGWICAMTGDGVNDAPALQRADIGVAMGKEGTEVAKAASDMILTDDNFCSIVKAIEKGRVIYAGIQKFICFIMSVHLAEVLQIFLCIVTSIPVMRKPLQILFLILVTDLPPSIALGFEPAEKSTMTRPPRPKSHPIVMLWMWQGIIVNGVIITVCIFSIYLIALWAYAGALQSDDITDSTRESCVIWSPNFITPSLNFDCGLWKACNSNANFGDALHTEADCSNWKLQSQYAIEQAVADAVVSATLGATGAIYTSHGNEKCNICINESVRRARTCAFISLVWAEGFRAYTSRSFINGIWVDTFTNTSMNKAILLAQVTLILVLFVPGLNSVFDLYPYEIHGFGYFLAFLGAVSCLIICEMYKLYSRRAVLAIDAMHS